jgi:CHASE2 domain-containing sensor protein
LAFGAALLALRLAGRLAGRWRARRAPELAMWSASLLAYAAASAALAWGAAAGWNEAAFRVYYLCGGLLTAPLLGAGSLLLLGKRWVIPVMVAYAGLATGVVLAEPLTAAVSGTSIPEAQEHLDYFPARILALVANIGGTAAVVSVAIVSIRRRPLGMSLILAGVGVAAVGSALAGLGAAQTAAFSAIAVVFLYTGFTVSSAKRQDALPAEAR